MLVRTFFIFNNCKKERRGNKERGRWWQTGENNEHLFYIYFDFNHHINCQHILTYSSGRITLKSFSHLLWSVSIIYRQLIYYDGNAENTLLNSKAHIIYLTHLTTLECTQLLYLKYNNMWHDMSPNVGRDISGAAEWNFFKIVWNEGTAHYNCMAM